MHSSYVIPAREDLKKGAERVKAEYQGENAERKQLITVFETINNVIEQYPSSPSDYTEEDLQQICVALSLFCRERIIATDPKYKLLSPKLISPDFTEGMVWSSGSKLARLLLDQLGVKDVSEIDIKWQLIFVWKLYYFISNHKNFNDLYQLQQPSLIEVKSQILEFLRRLLVQVCPEVDKLIHAIPTETALDYDMQLMVEAYLKPRATVSWLNLFSATDPINDDDKFFAQLADAVSRKDFPKESNIPDNELTRSQRTKMGLLLFILQSTKSAILSNLCREALNIDAISEISPMQQLSYLSALNSFLHDNTNLTDLEESGRLHFAKDNLLKDVDMKLNPLCKKLTTIISQLESKPSSSESTLAKIGERVFAVVGYGAGLVGGFTLSNTNYSIELESILAEIIKSISKTLFDSSTGGIFGAYLAHFIFQAIIAVAGAQVLEAFGKVVGKATGSTVDWVVNQVCDGLSNLCKNVSDPKILIKEGDRDLIKCLLSLPQEVFLKHEGQRLRHLLQGDQLISERRFVCGV